VLDFGSDNEMLGKNKAILNERFEPIAY